MIDRDKTLVHLNTGKDALGVEKFNHALSTGGLLEQSFFEKDAARDVLTQTLGGEQHRTVLSTLLLSVLDAYVVKTLLDGASALIGSEDTLARSGNELGVLSQFLGAFLGKLDLKHCETSTTNITWVS